MAKVDIWMPIYISDYLRDTEELSGPEHGAYLLLLMHYWVKRGEIGCDVERLARVCRSDEVTCRFILGKYFGLENGTYRNRRADEEMEKAERKRASAIENGKKGGKPKKNNPDITYGLAVGNPDHNPQESSSPSPSPTHIDKNIILNMRFKTPTLEEVKTYCLERSNTVDPGKFMAYYESKGWKVGKSAMKDWKAAVRTWEQNGFDSLKVSKRTTYLDIPEA